MKLFTRVLVIAALLMALQWNLIAPPTADAATTWKYTALGDSLATGAWPLAWKGYVPRYRDHLQADNPGVTVSMTNRGVNGWTSGQLLSALQTDATMQDAVRTANVVTWDIGGNDLRDARNRYKAQTCGGADNQQCLRETEAAFTANWDAIVARILSLRGANPTVFRTMDIYNPYVRQDKAANTWPDLSDGGKNDFQVFKYYLDRINGYINSSVAAKGVKVAQVYLAFNGANGETDPNTLNYIAFDGLHPNDLGHAKIADLLRRLAYAPLK